MDLPNFDSCLKKFKLSGILYLMFQLFPVLGFGARLPPDGRVSHCFYVNGHDANPYCQGITGRTKALFTFSVRNYLA